MITVQWKEDKPVSIQTKIGAGCSGNLDSFPGMGKRRYTSPYWSDRLWGPPSLLVYYVGSFPKDKADGAPSSILTSVEC
jgi:hypothetical protein